MTKAAAAAAGSVSEAQKPRKHLPRRQPTGTIAAVEWAARLAGEAGRKRQRRSTSAGRKPRYRWGEGKGEKRILTQLYFCMFGFSLSLLLAASSFSS